MKNSYENLMGGTWLLTFLEHQNSLFYYQNPKFSVQGSAPIANPRRRKLLRSFRGLCVISATFAFILTCHKKPGRNPAIYELEISNAGPVLKDLVSSWTTTTSDSKNIN